MVSYGLCLFALFSLSSENWQAASSASKIFDSLGFFGDTLLKDVINNKKLALFPPKKLWAFLHFKTCCKIEDDKPTFILHLMIFIVSHLKWCQYIKNSVIQTPRTSNFSRWGQKYCFVVLSISKSQKKKSLCSYWYMLVLREHLLTSWIISINLIKICLQIFNNLMWTQTFQI